MDIELTSLCKTCHRKIQSFSTKLNCNNCKSKHHVKCVTFENEAGINQDIWYCLECTQSIFPFNHYDEDEEFYHAIIECQLDCTFRLHEINSKIFFPFEINQDVDTYLGETDPDLQFYTEINHIQNTKCDYYVEDSFIKNYVDVKDVSYDNNLSFFHLNVKVSQNIMMKWKCTLIH